MTSLSRALPSLFLLLWAALQGAEIPKAPPAPKPDDRYKADILLIVAHPDDETAVTGYLAKALFDEHKRVAVIFGTRGNGGGNAMGNEQAASLGAEREIEARKALAYFGVMNVWFLSGPDTPGQDVLRSLETWNHGAALWDAVRLTRLTRPDVIFTWLPVYVAGENHGDHQAAGVIATEVFDMAGDPTVFPEQIAAPRDANNIYNLTEGLHPWQPKKIYYFSDASHSDFQEGKGPKYETTGKSPVKQTPYYRLAAEEMSFHLTQGDTGQAAKEALAKGDFHYFEEPVRLIFGKSLVPAKTTGDVFEGITTGPLLFSPAHGYRPPHLSGLSVELEGPWGFYREFWKAHSLEHLAGLLPEAEVNVAPGEKLHLPIAIQNASSDEQEVTLTAVLPEGWSNPQGVARYRISAQDGYTVQTTVIAPSRKSSGWENVTWKAETGGRTIGSITVRVSVSPGGLPQ